jgi:hypothetical protein
MVELSQLRSGALNGKMMTFRCHSSALRPRAFTHTRAPEFPGIPSRANSGARPLTIVQFACTSLTVRDFTNSKTRGSLLWGISQGSTRTYLLSLSDSDVCGKDRNSRLWPRRAPISRRPMTSRVVDREVTSRPLNCRARQVDRPSSSLASVHPPRTRRSARAPSRPGPGWRWLPRGRVRPA